MTTKRFYKVPANHEGVIKAVLERDPCLEVIGEARDGLEALDRCREASPDLVLMDLSMPNMGGMEATRRLKSAARRPWCSCSPPTRTRACSRP